MKTFRLLVEIVFRVAIMGILVIAAIHMQRGQLEKAQLDLIMAMVAGISLDKKSVHNLNKE